MVVALVLVLVALGSVAFHFWSPWWWTPIASNWGFIDDTIIITFWITGVVFVAVVLFTAYCVYRYRYQEGRRAEYEPESAKLEIWLSVFTSIGVVAMLTPGLFAWADYVTVPDEATEFEVMGQQWQWSYRYPGADGLLGTTNALNVSPDNPFGINPDDPNGQDDILIEGDDLHLPLDKPVKVLLRSLDVLHDFYVPQFRAKMDMVPGMVTFFWLTPTRTGTFEILCAELCGTGHHIMRGYVVVEEESAYQEWLAEQSTFAETLAQAGNGAGNVVGMVSNETPEGSVQQGPEPVEPDDEFVKGAI